MNDTDLHELENMTPDSWALLFAMHSFEELAAVGAVEIHGMHLSDLARQIVEATRGTPKEPPFEAVIEMAKMAIVKGFVRYTGPMAPTRVLQ